MAGAASHDERALQVLTALDEAAAAVAEKAREAERLKYDFVSIASHELRTPISVVHGIAATLHARVDELEQDQVHALLGQRVVHTAHPPQLAAPRPPLPP